MPSLSEVTLAPHMECSADLSSIGLASDSRLNALEGLFCLLCPLRSALSPGSSTQRSATVSTADADKCHNCRHHADADTTQQQQQQQQQHAYQDCMMGYAVVNLYRRQQVCSGGRYG